MNEKKHMKLKAITCHTRYIYVIKTKFVNEKSIYFLNSIVKWMNHFYNGFHHQIRKNHTKLWEK